MGVWDRVSPSEIQYRGDERYCDLGSSIVLVNHAVDDLAEGDLLIKLGEEVDDDIVYSGRYYVVVNVEKDDGYVLTSVASTLVIGRVEFEERLDGHEGDTLKDFGFRRVCNRPRG